MSIHDRPTGTAGPAIDHVVSVDGTRIGFERLGAGPPLVVVHGGTADRSRWAPVAPTLAEWHTVLLVDRRGRGASGDNAQLPYSLGLEVDDLLAVVETAADRSGTPVALLGHSFGALCSLEALLRTDRISRAVLYEPPFTSPELPVLRPGVLQRMQRQLDAGDREAVLETMFIDVGGADRATFELLRRSPAWPARIEAVPTLLREVRAVDSYVFDPDRFSAMATPTAFLVGTESPAYLHAAAASASAALPNGEVVRLPGQAHQAMDTAPQLFLDAVHRHLE
jgi:pimeloyl-ACP methyl ester carboxylesterase